MQSTAAPAQPPAALAAPVPAPQAAASVPSAGSLGAGQTLPPEAAPAPAPQQPQPPVGVAIPVTPLVGQPTAAPAPAPQAQLQPQVANPSIQVTPLQAAPGPGPVPGGFPSSAPAPAPANISALLSSLSPPERSVVANTNLSTLAGAAGENLTSVNGQNLAPYSNATAGAMIGNIIASGNPLAPVPAPEAAPLMQAVAAAGVPQLAAAARPPAAGGAARRAPQDPCRKDCQHPRSFSRYIGLSP